MVRHTYKPRRGVHCTGEASENVTGIGEGRQRVQHVASESWLNLRGECSDAHHLQLSLFRQLSTRALSRTWGALTRQEIPTWLRRPLLGFYVWAFGCKMEEAEEPDLVAYSSLTELFTRKLKTTARLIAKECQLVRANALPNT